jgi:hypothetical protein
MGHHTILALYSIPVPHLRASQYADQTLEKKRAALLWMEGGGLCCWRLPFDDQLKM